MRSRSIKASLMNSLRDELRSATRSQHDAIERVVNLMRPDIVMGEYVDYLCTFYGFYFSLEPRLIEGDARFFNDALSLGQSRKLPWLKRDLKKIVGSACVEKVPVCVHLPLIDTGPSVLGCAYVIEGSMLGALVIYRHVHKCLGVTPDNGAAYINGHGKRTGFRWKKFLRALDANAFTSRQRAECVNAAAATFSTMHAWFLKRADADDVMRGIGGSGARRGVNPASVPQ